MNETMQNTINEALLSIIGSVTSAKDFLLSELPEVVEQLLLWKLCESLVLNGIALTLVIILIYLNVKYSPRILAWDEWDTPAPVFFTGGLGGVALVIFVNMDLDWLMILVAPKVYLIEYMTELVK